MLARGETQPAAPASCGPRLASNSLVLYFLGLSLWVTERTLCGLVQPLQLHAIWHVCAGLGTYNMLLFYVAARVEADSEGEGAGVALG